MVFLGSIGMLLDVFVTKLTVKYTGNLNYKRLDNLPVALFASPYSKQLSTIKALYLLKSDLKVVTFGVLNGKDAMTCNLFRFFHVLKYC
jgi:hypothetical protein